MKKLILITAIISLCLNAIAQNIAKPSDLAKFTGTWVYKKDGKEIEIILKIVSERVPNQNVFMDELEGYHIYKSDNKTIDNSLERNKVSLNTGYFFERDTPNKVKLLFFDDLKQKGGYAIITFIAGNPDKIKWDLFNKTENRIINKAGEPKKKFDKEFTIPEILILERKS